MKPTPSNPTLDLMGEETRKHLLKSAEIKTAVADRCVSEITAAAVLLIETLRNDGKILLCGNGGSAADCQHISAEFASILSQDFMRPALAAIALTTDTSFITANANDFGFEGIFERQVEAIGRPGDALIGISTSGNSKNVLRALNYAGDRGIKTIALTAESGGQMANIADVTIKIPSDNTQFIQESHISVGHIICALVEIGIFKNTD
jgi:phosphoheptose isomerase